MADWENEQYEDLASELRQKVGQEFRWEAEDVERETAQQILRGRTLGEVAFEWMSRGDSVLVSTSNRSFGGQVTYASGDLAVIETEHLVVNVNLEGMVALRLLERVTKGGTSPTVGSPTFRARMMELEQTGEIVECLAPAIAEEIKGRVTVVGRDHVLLTDSDHRDWFIPLPTIALVVQAMPDLPPGQHPPLQ